MPAPAHASPAVPAAAPVHEGEIDVATEGHAEVAQRMSVLHCTPYGARAAYVFAHGAGAGMTHPFMAAAAAGLAERGIATLRYQFPFMQRGSRRPDAPAIAQATVRAAVAAAAAQWPALPLVAGGKSFGARMTSQAQAAAPLPGVTGLAFLGFPLHPAGRPASDRAAHLADVALPMYFIQGTRDALAELRRLRGVVERLGSRAALYEVEAADHAFHVLVRSGRRDDEVLVEVLDALADWILETTDLPGR